MDLPHDLLDGSVESQYLAVGSKGVGDRVRDDGEVLEEWIDKVIRHGNIGGEVGSSSDAGGTACIPSGVGCSRDL